MKNMMIIFLIFFLGCSPESMKEDSMSEQEIVEVRKAIETRVMDHVSNMRSLNLEKMLTFWVDSDDFVACPDGKMIVGFSDFANRQRQNWAQVSSVDNVDVYEKHTCVLARDAASFTFKFSWNRTKKSGEKTYSKGTWTYVFKLIDGQWKVVHSTGTHIYE